MPLSFLHLHLDKNQNTVIVLNKLRKNITKLYVNKMLYG